MSDNQTLYSEEFLQQVEELKKEIGEVLQDNSLSEDDKKDFENYLELLSSKSNLEEKFSFFQFLLGRFFYRQDELEKALYCFNKIKEQHNLECYNTAQKIINIIHEIQGSLNKIFNNLNIYIKYTKDTHIEEIFKI
ncbi:MAG: hypothetical protein IJ881_06410 [Neisseriaceae bacterium]|nr:hypothetical protein [Neisseriaceae bacterium]